MHTDNKLVIFLMPKEIRIVSGAKSYMRIGFLKYDEICRFLEIFEEVL
jgi:hypothetical protein